MSSVGHNLYGRTDAQFFLAAHGEGRGLGKRVKSLIATPQNENDRGV